MAEGVELPQVPISFSWLRQPASWSLEGGQLTIEAGAKTDWFLDPGRREPMLNAPALVGRPPDEDFTLLARVGMEAASTFDAGVLFIHADDQVWAKLCLELSPEGRPMIVSVVTRGVSDDCNSETVERGEAWLRVARVGGAFAFHASQDGERWAMVRHFALPTSDVDVGFVAQSPTGRRQHCDLLRHRLLEATTRRSPRWKLTTRLRTARVGVPGEARRRVGSTGRHPDSAALRVIRSARRRT